MIKIILSSNILLLTFLLSGCGSSGSSSKDTPKEVVKEEVEKIVDDAVDGISDTVEGEVEDAVDSATDGAKEIADSASDTIDEAVESVEDNVKEIIEDKITNDPQTTNTSAEQYYKYLWHIDSKNSSLNNISSEVSSVFNDEYVIGSINENADINILDAWKITRGKGVVVAVIDDGADVEHEDLKENIFLTYNADLDNDDVTNKSNDIKTSLHGNTCAGFIVAPVNGVGIIGTAPESKIIVIKQDEGDVIKTIRAFEYAKNNGAKVISCSWGTENVSDALESELKSLYDAGITVVFASGNDGKSLDVDIVDESEVEWVIGVGASGENNDVTSYSNYGTNIDILAPGGDAELSVGILGLDDTGTQGESNNYGNLVSDSYSFTNGTSFSAPVTAGVVALMYSVNPNITPKQVRDILVDTADKIGVNASYNSNGFDEKRAYGKINATKAVLSTQALLD